MWNMDGTFLWNNKQTDESPRERKKLMDEFQDICETENIWWPGAEVVNWYQFGLRMLEGFLRHLVLSSAK